MFYFLFDIEHSWPQVLGLVAFVAGLVSLLAGMGRRKLAASLAIAIVLSSVGAVLSFFVGLKIFTMVDHGPHGDMDLFGPFPLLILMAVAVFLILLVISVVWRVRSGGMTGERTPKSGVLLVFGCLAMLLTAAGVADAVIGSTPALASTERLIRRMEEGGGASVVDPELVRRGSKAVPAIIAALHRYPYADTLYNHRPVAILLRTLGAIGGPEATTEIRRWTASDIRPDERGVAIDVLAGQGDRAVLPLIAEMLGKQSPLDLDRMPYKELFHALGVLKAGDQVGLIRSAVFHDTNGMFFKINASIPALVAIDSDEAWALIFDLATHKELSVVQDTLSVLAKFPRPRTFLLLSKVLDDPDHARSTLAYSELVNMERDLQWKVPPWPWSQASLEFLQAALKKQTDAKQ